MQILKECMRKILVLLLFTQSQRYAFIVLEITRVIRLLPFYLQNYCVRLLQRRPVYQETTVVRLEVWSLAIFPASSPTVYG
jgi:hypothetical protein